MRPTSVESAGALIAPYELDLRIHHLDAPGPVRVQIGLPVQHHPLSFFQSLLQICAMKKPGVQPAGGVLRGHVKHWGAPSHESNRVAAGDLCKHRMNLPGHNFRDWREMDAVLVAEGQIAQQVGDGCDAAFL